MFYCDLTNRCSTCSPDQTARILIRGGVLTHFSIIRQLIIGSHSDYHLLGNNPSAALYGRHLPLHKGGFGRSRASGGPVGRWIMRQWGPRRSPASAGSPGRGGAAERLRFPPLRRKQRMRSLRRRGEECAPQNSTILPARAAPMRVNPNSFASATDSAVGMALLANTGTPARMTFSTISTGILPLV